MLAYESRSQSRVCQNSGAAMAPCTPVEMSLQDHEVSMSYRRQMHKSSYSPVAESIHCEFANVINTS